MRSLSLLMIFFFLLFQKSTNAQVPATDIWLFDLSNENGKYILSNPKNITARKGYDNQPCFSSDGKKIIYTSAIDGQTEIFEYSIPEQKTIRKTQTKTSEYSPQYYMHDQEFTVVMVEEDSAQTLWVNPGSKKASRINKNIQEKVGYYLFLDKETCVTYILGAPAKMKLINFNNDNEKILSDSIGRCFKKIPGSKDFSFTRLVSSSKTLYRFNTEKKQMTAICNLPAEDYDWVDQAIILSSDKTRIMIKKSAREDWMIVPITEQIALSGITRIAYSPISKKLAVVAAE